MTALLTDRLTLFKHSDLGPPSESGLQALDPSVTESVRPEILRSVINVSLGWSMGKSTGNPCFNQKLWGVVPLDFPIKHFWECFLKVTVDIGPH